MWVTKGVMFINRNLCSFCGYLVCSILTKGEVVINMFLYGQANCANFIHNITTVYGRYFLDTAW